MITAHNGFGSAAGRPRRGVTTWSSVRLTFLMLLIGGYLVFGYSFMQLRIPPTGMGVPIGEVALAALLLSINWPLVLARIGTVLFLLPLLLWWGWGFARLAIDGVREGPWAFRDATQLIEALYLVVGFALATTASDIARFSVWFRRIIITSCVVSLTYVFADQLVAISPTLSGGSNQAIPIFGTFATAAVMLLLGAFQCLTRSSRSRAEGVCFTLLAGLLVSYVVLVIQARTTYVQLVSLIALLLWVRPTALRRFGSTIPIFAVLLAIVGSLELRVSGRLSSEISFDFLWNHVLTIFGIGSTGSLGEAASGVSLRFHWWLRLYHELTDDPVTLLSGLGFGVALTDFRDTLGILAREPHNSVISVVARLGLIGGIGWIWLQMLLFFLAVRTYRAARRLGWYDEAQLVLLILAFAVLTLSSCFGEDTMEKPYNAIPYYALWGVLLRIAYRVRAAVAPTAAAVETDVEPREMAARRTGGRLRPQ